MLYALVEQHLPSFQRNLAERERTLPRYIVDEFRDYLACGRLQHGCIRVKCNGCRHELARRIAQGERCVPAPSDAQMVDLLATIIARILRRLLRDGCLTEDAEQPRLELATEDIIDEFAAASIH